MHPPIDTLVSLSLGPSPERDQDISGMAPTKSDSESDSEFGVFGDYDSDTDSASDTPVQSSVTGLWYDVDALDGDTQELVRELFRPAAPAETPSIVLEWCGVSNDPDVFAFQLQETVPRTVRIGAPSSRIPRPSCNCTGAEDRPCRHLVWLLDQIAAATLAETDLVLDPAGPRSLGSAYARIRDFHMDVLAPTLHCRAGPPDGRPDDHRVREAREILAALKGVQTKLTGARPGTDRVRLAARNRHVRDLVVRGDLERTLLRLLVRNDAFFGMFLRLLGPADAVHDPFRKIQQRIDGVLARLERTTTTTTGEPVSVAWAAQHVELAAAQILQLLHADSSTTRRASAAHTVVHILAAIVSRHNRDAHPGATLDDRNLYQRLVGNRSDADTDMLLDVLDAVHDQTQFLHSTESIWRRIQRNGYRPAYKARMDAVLERMRACVVPGSEPDEEQDTKQEQGQQGQPTSAGAKRSDPPLGAPEPRPKRVR